MFYYFSFRLFLPTLASLCGYKFARIALYWSNFPILFFWIVCLFWPLISYFFICILNVFFNHFLFVDLESFDFLSLLFSPEFTLATPEGFSVLVDDTNSPLYAEGRMVPHHEDYFSSLQTDCWGTQFGYSRHAPLGTNQNPLLPEEVAVHSGWFSSLRHELSHLFDRLFSSNETLARKEAAKSSARIIYRCLRELGFNYDSFNNLVQLYMQGGSVNVHPGNNLVRSVTEINGIKTISISPDSTITPR